MKQFLAKSSGRSVSSPPNVPSSSSSSSSSPNVTPRAGGPTTTSSSSSGGGYFHNLLETRSSYRHPLRIGLLLLFSIIVAVIFLVLLLLFMISRNVTPSIGWLADLTDRAQQHPLAYSILVMALLVFSVVFCIPIGITIVAVSFAFKWWALLICYPPTVAASVLAFYLARMTCFTRFSGLLQSYQKVRVFSHIIQDDPLRFCLLFRLSPLPLFVKNYGLSTMGVPVGPYFLACCVSSLPWTILEVSLGASAQTVVEAWRSDNPRKGIGEMCVLVGSVMILLVAIWMVARAYRKRAVPMREVELGSVIGSVYGKEETGIDESF